MKKINNPLETEEQQAVVQFLEMKGLKFSAIPNSTYTKSWSQKAKNKADGLRAGLPDLLIVLPSKLLFIEMKRLKGSVVSTVQKEWIEALNDINKSIEAVVCKGAEEAIYKINSEINKELLKPYRV